MEIAIKILMSLDLFLAIVIIALVMMQRSKAGGGLGGLTGGATEEVFGADTGNVLSRMTVICALLFLAVTLGIGMLQKQKNRLSQNSVMDKELATSDKKAASGNPEKAKKKATDAVTQKQNVNNDSNTTKDVAKKTVKKANDAGNDAVKDVKKEATTPIK